MTTGLTERPAIYDALRDETGDDPARIEQACGQPWLSWPVGEMAERLAAMCVGLVEVEATTDLEPTPARLRLEAAALAYAATQRPLLPLLAELQIVAARELLAAAVALADEVAGG